MDWGVIDKGRSQLIYVQILTLIQKAITERRLNPDEQIPSASDLSEIWGVSRMTVRQALQELARRGVLYTIPRRGTFVALNPKIEPPVDNLYGFTEAFSQHGQHPSSLVVSVGVIPAVKNVCEALLVEPGTPVIQIVRVRMINGQALGIERSHLKKADFAGLELFDWSGVSLYSTLRNQYHVDLDHAYHSIEAAEADSESAKLLGVRIGFPVVLVERFTYTSGNQPVEYVTSVYRSDRVRFKIGAVEKHPMRFEPS
jgi:GntR family transcriptional regulator